jgi:uncharacterized membrane protein YtjA (UPF0391 family)
LGHLILFLLLRRHSFDVFRRLYAFYALLAYLLLPLFSSNARTAQKNARKEEQVMLNWSLTFLVIGLIAAVLGFTGIAGAATQIAWILFVVFLVLFLVSLVTSRGRIL